MMINTWLIIRMLTSLWGNLPAMTCLRQLTSSLWMTGRQSRSLIISLSSLMVKATWSGPRLPTRYTFRTRLLESASRACWDMSVFYNTNRGKKYQYTPYVSWSRVFPKTTKGVQQNLPTEFPTKIWSLFTEKEWKSEQAHIPHASTLPENAVYNEWQFQALVTGNRTENQFHLSCTK